MFTPLNIAPNNITSLGFSDLEKPDHSSYNLSNMTAMAPLIILFIIHLRTTHIPA